MKKTPQSTNPAGAIQRWPVALFATALLAFLLILPFALVRGLAATRERSHAVTLLYAADLRMPAANGELREDKSRSLFAAKFALGPEEMTEAKKKFTRIPVLPEEWVGELRKVCGNRSEWIPENALPGPWCGASGEKDGLYWRALVDESLGAVWIIARRLDGKTST